MARTTSSGPSSVSWAPAPGCSAVDVVLPKWGMTMQEGTITEWHVAAGDSVSEGQVIATVETEKVDAEIEAPASGVLAELLVGPGETIPVGTVIARIQA